MAVGRYKLENSAREILLDVLRSFSAPARASELKYWYKAMKKVCPQMEPWADDFARGAFVDIDTIMMDGKLGDNKFWSLSIARKRSL